MLPCGALNMRELETLARERLSAMAYDYYASGAQDEHTLRDNVAAWGNAVSRFALPRCSTGAERAGYVHRGTRTASSDADPRRTHGVPQARLPRRGAGDECAPTSRWAQVMVLSTLSNTREEEVCAAAPGRVWFQLYVYRDRGATSALVARAEAAGVGALVVTVDAPILGRRERGVRNGFHLPAGLRVENMSASGYGDVEHCEGESGLAAYVAECLDPSLSWKDIAWIRSITRLPVLVKGLVRPDDACRAVDSGVSGVVVSSPGIGRQSSMGRPRRRPSSDRLPTPSPAGWRCSSMVASAAVATSSRRWRSARGAVLVGRPIYSVGLAVAGEEGAFFGARHASRGARTRDDARGLRANRRRDAGARCVKRVLVKGAGGWDRLTFEDTSDPKPGAGEVLVRTDAVGVNFADVLVRMGLYASAKKYVGWPITPGFEFAGAVAATGEGVTDVAPGTRVLGLTRFDGYATHVVVPRDQIFRIPRGLTMSEAAALPVASLTAWYAPSSSWRRRRPG